MRGQNAPAWLVRKRWRKELRRRRVHAGMRRNVRPPFLERLEQSRKDGRYVQSSHGKNRRKRSGLFS